jgi:hypothetical protein
VGRAHEQNADEADRSGARDQRRDRPVGAACGAHQGSCDQRDEPGDGTAELVAQGGAAIADVRGEHFRIQRGRRRVHGVVADADADDHREPRQHRNLGRDHEIERDRERDDEQRSEHDHRATAELVRERAQERDRDQLRRAGGRYADQVSVLRQAVDGRRVGQGVDGHGVEQHAMRQVQSGGQQHVAGFGSQ